MSTISQIRLSIPANTNFQTVDADGTPHVYRCAQNIIFAIRNKSLCLKSDVGFFLLSTTETPCVGDSDIIGEHNNETWQVKGFEHLQHDKYDVAICFNNQKVVCHKMQIYEKTLYHYWKVQNALTHPEYVEIDSFDFGAKYEVLPTLPPAKPAACQDRVLYVKKNTEVTLGNECYVLCQDIAIVMESGVISSLSTRCYYLDGIVGNVCMNPFQSGKLDLKCVELKTRDGYTFRVTIDLFQEKIMKCRFYAQNLSYIDGFKTSPTSWKNDGFEWCRVSAQNYYKIYEIKLIMQPLRNCADSVVSKKVNKLMDACDEGLECFLKLALKCVAMTASVDIMQYLISKGADPHDPEVICNAVKKGHLVMVQYLVELGVDVKSKADMLLKLAIKWKSLPMVKYLVVQGGNLGDDYVTCLNLAIAKADNDISDWLKSLPEYAAWRQEKIMRNLAAINKILLDVSQLIE